MASLPRLTSLSTGGGCACKLPARDLAAVLERLPRRADARLLFGDGRGDDAAIYQIAPGVAIVQTIDFFSPLVDDPFIYGQIAAANALSDVFALGAKPMLALNVVGFPSKVLGLEILGEILRGGADKCAEAGVTIVGGHTIEDPEPKYGLAVTGVVDPARAVLNRGARPGDALVLTKPIGTGIVANAIKRDVADPEAVAEALASMTQLNQRASELMVAHGAHACTDVTGFGLLGHLHNLLAASGVAAHLQADRVPVMKGAERLALAGHFPGGTRRNLEAAAAYATFAPGVDERRRLILADAQTSGGLLIACPPDRTDALESALRQSGLTAATLGEVREGSAGTIGVN
jgi:selenide, water dikinase